MCFPQFAVAESLDTLPYTRFAAVLRPIRPQMAIVKAEHLRRQPRRYVHAIRNMSDRNLILGLARIKARPHRPRDLAVERRDGVRPARKPQAKYRHAKF